MASQTPVTDFLIALGSNSDWLDLWRRGKRGSVLRQYDPDGQRLSLDDRDLLADGDAVAIRDKVLEEARGVSEAQPLMVIGI